MRVGFEGKLNIEVASYLRGHTFKLDLLQNRKFATAISEAVEPVIERDERVPDFESLQTRG
jgi:hypothetical protein